MLQSCFIMAQAPGEETVAILKWLGVLVVVAVVFGVIGVIVLRRIRAQDETVPGGFTTGFTLADLRQMHAEGQLSDEEFAAARAKMIARSRAALDEDPAADLSTTHPPSGPRRQGPEKAEDPDRPDNPDDGET